MFDDIELYEKMIDVAYDTDLPKPKTYVCGAKKDTCIYVYPEEYRIHDRIVVDGAHKYIKWLDVKHIDLYRCGHMNYLKRRKRLAIPTYVEGKKTLIGIHINLCNMEENVNDVRELLSRAESEFGSIHTVLR
jgi:hypothetical protein